MGVPAVKKIKRPRDAANGLNSPIGGLVSDFRQRQKTGVEFLTAIGREN